MSETFREIKEQNETAPQNMADPIRHANISNYHNKHRLWKESFYDLLKQKVQTHSDYSITGRV